MFNIGTQELLIILFVVLMLFGAKRIPEVARSLGKGVGDFRDALSGVERELKGEGPARPRPADGAIPRFAPTPDPGKLPAPAPGGEAGEATTNPGAWDEDPPPDRGSGPAG